MNYPEAVGFIDSFINYEKTGSFDYPEAFKLDRMRALARELGNPQNAYASILIAGSKGKGSTAAILSSILRMENYKVGLYTSPHLANVRERIRVNGLLMSEARFVEAALLLRRVLDTPRWRKDPPTYFEVLTAMAFHHFRESKAQIAVLEAGLGGLYDSTNIVNAPVAGLTPVSLEHAEKLGRTISKIAVQKCGILRERQTVVSAPQTAEAEAVIGKAAAERQARLLRVGREIKVFPRDYGEDYQRFDLRSSFGNWFELRIGLRGSHQMDNAALAVGLAKGLEERTRLKVTDQAVRQGVLDAFWPGRLEKISEEPAVVLDGAHNPASMRALLEGVKRHFHYGKLLLVLGVSNDKDLAGILRELLPEVHLVVATQSAHERALPARRIAQSVENFSGEIFTEEDPWAAFQRAKAFAGPSDLVLVTGSLYLVGEIRSRARKGFLSD